MIHMGNPKCNHWVQAGLIWPYHNQMNQLECQKPNSKGVKLPEIKSQEDQIAHQQEDYQPEHLGIDDNFLSDYYTFSPRGPPGGSRREQKAKDSKDWTTLQQPIAFS